MNRKAFKVAILTGLVALVALAVGVTASGAKSKGELPEYLGSKACLGCHVDKFENWDDTGHAHMLTQVYKWGDLPGDINTAPEELQAELKRADWIVAGQRFLARDPQTGELKYLNVQWRADQDQYVSYKGGSNWETSCAGCHTTGWDTTVAEFVEPGIGCEMCHGPGRDHVLGKGDISKITVTNDSQACGQCHTGGKSPTGTAWPDGYLPGGSLADTGFVTPAIPDPHEGLFPSLKGYPKIRQYPLWENSAHANAVVSLEESDHARDYCYKCHAAEAFQNSLDGKTAPKNHNYEDAVSCSACHDPHNNIAEGQLRQPADQLCLTCHTGSIPEGGSLKPGSTAHHPMKEMLAGYGAIDVPQTTGAHSELTCVECHMTEGNHQMRVIKPNEVVGTTRQDSCTACHTDSSADSRGIYLEMWQEATERRVNQAKNDMAVIEAALKANPSALSADLKLKYDTAKTNLSFVEADASMGVHNFEYAIKILNSATTSLSEVRKAIGK